MCGLGDVNVVATDWVASVHLSLSQVITEGPPPPPATTRAVGLCPELSSGAGCRSGPARARRVVGRVSRALMRVHKQCVSHRKESM